MYSLKTHSKRLNVTGIEELAGAEEAEEMSKKLGDHLVGGLCAEEVEGTAQLCKAGSVVAAGTLQKGGCSLTEKTPEKNRRSCSKAKKATTRKNNECKRSMPKKKRQTKSCRHRSQRQTTGVRRPAGNPEESMP